MEEDYEQFQLWKESPNVSTGETTEARGVTSAQFMKLEVANRASSVKKLTGRCLDLEELIRRFKGTQVTRGEPLGKATA